MKIVQVTPRYPPHTGGVEKHVKEISERLVERGHEVTVLTADAGRGVNQQTIINGVTVKRHQSITVNDAFHLAPGIVTAVRQADADVIHAHNYHSLPVFLSALQVTGRPFIVTPHYHGGSANGFRDYLLSLYRPLGRWVLKRADAVIAVSEWENNRIQQDFSVGATVIPNGLDVGRFANVDTKKCDEPYLLTVGRLEEYKGVQDVIQALPELPEYKLFIVGSGSYRDELECIARKEGVSERVAFTGYVGDDQLAMIYAGADVYVNLSEFEAYGMSVAEALATGTPCVVRAEKALTDWIRKEGVTATPKSTPVELAKAVRTVRGIEPNVASLVTWKEVVSHLTGIYERVKKDS